jgi:AraC-like DNA-binding protein
MIEMTSYEAWSKFAARQSGAPPLAFVYGSRHAVPTTYYCRPHSHRSIEIVYHPTGNGVTRFETKPVIKFAERGAVIYSPREVHDQEMFCDGEDMCLHLAVSKDSPAPPPDGLHIPYIGDPLLIEEISALSQVGPQETMVERSVSSFRATAILLALTSLACADHERQQASPAERRILMAEQYIRENSATIVSMKQVAGHVGISYDFLRHTFRKLRGKSLVRYCNEVRVERVKTLLTHSKLSLKEIGSACGFNDEYYLSTVFRNMTGTTPGQYRKNRV